MSALKSDSQSEIVRDVDSELGTVPIICSTSCTCDCRESISLQEFLSNFYYCTLNFRQP
jgi:hypothetical protein